MRAPKYYVLVHGLGLSKTVWTKLQGVATSNILIACDVPGHGEGHRLKYYDFGSLWKVVHEVLSPSQWRHAVIVLHSMSSAFLPEINLSKIPPMGIILIEGNISAEDSEWSRYIANLTEENYHNWFNRMIKIAPYILREQLKTHQIRNDLIHFSKGFTQVDKIALKEIANQTYLRSSNGEIIRAIKNLKVPIKYLRGEKSTSRSESSKILDNFQIPIINIPRSGHYPMIDNPHATWEVILNLNNTF